mmetsp:Transcript_30886/g.78734  ORF Transcript_30886/g.78734 Transcript_30886/m.78734 type:complete len:249 (+) Transcript_30886:1969-2715(+)
MVPSVSSTMRRGSSTLTKLLHVAAVVESLHVLLLHGVRHCNQRCRMRAAGAFAVLEHLQEVVTPLCASPVLYKRVTEMVERPRSQRAVPMHEQVQTDGLRELLRPSVLVCQSNEGRGAARVSTQRQLKPLPGLAWLQLGQGAAHLRVTWLCAPHIQEHVKGIGGAPKALECPARTAPCAAVTSAQVAQKDREVVCLAQLRPELRQAREGPCVIWAELNALLQLVPLRTHRSAPLDGIHVSPAAGATAW